MILPSVVFCSLDNFTVKLQSYNDVHNFCVFYHKSAHTALSSLLMFTVEMFTEVFISKGLFSTDENQAGSGFISEFSL